MIERLAAKDQVLHMSQGQEQVEMEESSERVSYDGTYSSSSIFVVVELFSGEFS